MNFDQHGQKYSEVPVGRILLEKTSSRSNIRLRCVHAVLPHYTHHPRHPGIPPLHPHPTPYPSIHPISLRTSPSSLSAVFSGFNKPPTLFLPPPEVYALVHHRFQICPELETSTCERGSRQQLGASSFREITVNEGLSTSSFREITVNEGLSTSSFREITVIGGLSTSSFREITGNEGLSSSSFREITVN